MTLAPPLPAASAEEALLSRIFPGPAGCCLEVGAFDGVEGSATLAFERRGWRAILVEPLPELAERARVRRRGPVFAVAAGPAEGTVVIERTREDPALSGVAGNAFQAELRRLRGTSAEAIEVPQRTVDHLLAEAGVDRLDFATIDVEGFEAPVLAGFDLDRWRPRVVLLEDNSRGLDSAVCRLMAGRGYRRFRTTGVNDWYARAEDREIVTWSARARDRIRVRWRRLRARAKRWLPAPLKGVLRRIGAGE